MTVIYSGDQGLIIQELRKILGNDFSLYDKIIYESPNQMTKLLHSQAMFETSEKKIIFLGCNFLSNQNDANLAEDLFSVLLLNRHLKVFLTIEQDKLLTKPKLVSDFLSKVNVISIPKLNNYTMQNCIAINLANENISLNFDQLTLLASRLLPNAMVIENEIAKLKLFKKSEISNALLQNLFFEYNNNSIFKLVEYVILKKTSAAIDLFDNLVPIRYLPSEVLQIMASQILKIIFVFRSIPLKLNQSEITKKLGISIYQFNSIKKICEHTSIKILERFLNVILLLDIKIKKLDIDSQNSVRLFLSRGILR